MHAEIFVAALVLVVAVLVAADFFRRTGDSPHEHLERLAHDAGRESFPAPRAASAAMPRKGTHGAQKTWLVRTRLSLLAIISAAAAVLATAGVSRAAGALRGASFHSDVSSVRDGAVVSAVVACIAAAAALAAGLWSAILLIRSVLRPLHQLRVAVVDLAEVRLPDALRHISQAGGDGRTVGVQSVGLSSPDEIGDVARAFDQVQGEVMRLAADEAGLRGKLSDMFVELSGRSQSLVERQIRLIDELEQGEQDTERLASLFRMDHIAIRMRRYSQNLLVLAGRELPGRWNQPVTLPDVIRAAASEIEEYERVSLSVQPGIEVSGPAVNDVVHLIAELAENAASLSAADTPVEITGRTLASGGALIDVTDQGVGMNPDQMAQANWRLENPPATDVAVSRNMGLFVVGKLAARHGIKVRLQPAKSGGLSALVWLPDGVVILPDRAPPPGPGDPAGAGARRDARHALAPGPPGRTDPDRGLPAREAGARSPRPAPTPADLRMRQPPAATPVPVPANPVPANPVPANPVPGAGPEPDPAEGGRLPIYEAVESGWFGNRRQQSGGTAAVEGSWPPPVDRGWRAAETVIAPSSGGVTTAGLPARVPRANLVPGAIGAPQAAPAAPRSATAARDRLAGFQRGSSRGRAAAARPDGEDATC